MGRFCRSDVAVDRSCQSALGGEHLEGVGGCVPASAPSPRPALGRPRAQRHDRTEQGEEQERRRVQQPGHEHAPHRGQRHSDPRQPTTRGSLRRSGKGDLHLGRWSGHPRHGAEPGASAAARRDGCGRAGGTAEGHRGGAQPQDLTVVPGSRTAVELHLVQPAAVARSEVGDGDGSAAHPHRDVLARDVGVGEPDPGRAAAPENVPTLTERNGPPRLRTSDHVQLQRAGRAAATAPWNRALQPEDGAVDEFRCVER
jgi:hypothetical protein